MVLKWAKKQTEKKIIWRTIAASKTKFWLKIFFLFQFVTDGKEKASERERKLINSMKILSMLSNFLRF